MAGNYNEDKQIAAGAANTNKATDTVAFDERKLLGDEAEGSTAQTEQLTDEYEAVKRKLTGKFGLFVGILAALFTAFHFYALGIAAISAIDLRNFHMTIGMILIALIYPASRRHVSRVTIIDILWCICALAVGYYIWSQTTGGQNAFLMRAGVRPTQADVIFGGMAIVLILAMTRRVIGWPLVIVTLLLIAYARLAPHAPGIFFGRSFSWQRIISYSFSTDGIYGIPLGVSSTFVILFVTFGCFLKDSGAGEFYTRFAYSLAGRFRGGPAKVVVISSALFGMISGSSIANVATTGPVTIPLMKKAGFDKTYAAAVESVASTGGQFVPPIMGAAAFLMAEIIGVPISTIMLAAILPSVLYFFAVFIVIDFQAAKRGLLGLPKDQLPVLSQVLKAEGHLIIPLVVLIWVLLAGFTPIRAALLSIGTCIVLSWLRESTRMGPKEMYSALKNGALSCTEVIAACSAAGIIMALVNLTGLGLRLSTVMVTIAGDNLFLALVATAIVVIIMSLGLPTTACYIISAAIMAPVLVELGISPIQAHMFVFFFACLSGITPPVALVVFPACAIAKAKPFTVSLLAFRLGLVGFMMPFMFIYGPQLLWQGELFDIVFATITALIGTFLIGVASERYFGGPIAWPVAIIVFIAGVLIIAPGLKTDIIGVGLAATAMGITYMLRKRAAV